MNPTRSLLTAVLALSLLLAACGENTADGSAADDSADSAHDEAGDDDATDEPAEAGEGLTVVAPVYPLAWMAAEIAPGAEVELLTDGGEDPHDMELTPRSRGLLETADVVLTMGDIGYQPQVETALEASVGTVVSFKDAVGSDALLRWGADDDHGHDDDHGADGHDDGHDHDDDHGHDHGEFDPHAWFDAELMARMAAATGAALADVDPEAAEAYHANAAAIEERFEELHGEISGLLGADCAHDRVIVSHEAYAYLLEPFGIHQEGVSGTGGHGPASPQRIAELADLVEEEGIEHVLSEPVEGREDASAVASEAGLEVLDIYSLEVIDDEGLFAERGFAGLLRAQAETFATALDCG